MRYIHLRLLTYSLTSGYFRYILTSDIGGLSSGPRTFLISFCRYFYFREEFYFRSEFYFRFHAYFSASLARDLVTMAETVLHLDGSRRVSQQLQGPPKRNPTCRIGRCNLRYGLDLSLFLLPAIVYELLTNLGKFAQTAEASK